MMVLEQHIPVLQNDVIQYLMHDPNGIYIDATFGRGGHATALLQRLSPEGRLIVIDKDPQAIECAHKLFQKDERVLIHQGCFSQVLPLCRQLGCSGAVDGILFDLGVSSPQVNTPERGFSFMKDGPLDMRMDPTTGMSAKEWINKAQTQEISLVLKRFGEEKYSKRIAEKIVEKRGKKPITSTKELVEVIEHSIPHRESLKKHPATKSFQAIRIHINQELTVLETALQGALKVLAPHGRLCVISFHSLEDRIVKRFMRSLAHTQLPAHLPITAQEDKRDLAILAKKIKPSAEEIANNPRSRSAILRVAQKIG
ncbi:MAG TPA: 16S rRNA (cytosine(1402)-N(4))-methyltransferase RsmH [Gammaproteobacteria bacterium]|nr:16S rRNA (cytosine(1402)-N(4))-methyltransferase RsmH [Gammaproteobacteria bacterium]